MDSTEYDNVDAFRLIEFVQQYSLIWDKKHPQHKYKNFVDKAWLAISSKMGAPASTCVQRWTSLRQRYTREKKKENTTFGGYVSNWPYMKEISFLHKVVVSRKMRSRFSINQHNLNKIVVQDPLKIESTEPLFGYELNYSRSENSSDVPGTSCDTTHASPSREIKRFKADSASSSIPTLSANEAFGQTVGLLLDSETEVDQKRLRLKIMQIFIE